MAGILVELIHTPFGWIGMAANSRGLTQITVPRPTKAGAFADLEMAPTARFGANKHLRVARRELVRYFIRDPRADLNRIRLDFSRGTPFEMQVWRHVRAIPSGATRTYGEIARAVGRPLAARAVGRCNAKNPWAIVIPCHRLIGSSGALIGYGGGLALKQRLLELEGLSFAAPTAGATHG